VSWYVVGVGPNASTCAETLGPIATSIVHVKNTDDTEVVVSVINLEAA